MSRVKSQLSTCVLAFVLTVCVCALCTVSAWADDPTYELDAQDGVAVVQEDGAVAEQDGLEVDITQESAAAPEESLTGEDELGNASDEGETPEEPVSSEDEGETDTEEPTVEDPNTFDLKADFGAVGDGVADDTRAFNNALRKSRNNDVMTTIIVPSGTYRITSYLTIYSNTMLQLAPDATVIADASFGKGTFLGAVHTHNGKDCDGVGDTDCTTGGYDQIYNIVIDGGVWDRNITGSGQAAVMRFNHGHNITIKNATIKHASDHFLNLSGCRDVTISNVTFRDFVYTYITQKFAGKSYQNEAVHFDSMQQETEAAAYPQDKTVAYNIRVEGCKFINIPDGVGTHHPQSNIAKSHDITVTGCTFEGLSGRAVNIYRSDNFVVQNCVAKQCTSFVVTRDETCTIQNNRVIGTKLHKEIGSPSDQGDGIKVVDSRGAVIKNNVITGACGHGIYACRNVDPTICKITITGNVSVSLASTNDCYDIALGSNCVGTAKDNSVGIRGYANLNPPTSKVTESNNVITDAADKVKRLYGNVRYDTMEAIVKAGFSQKGGTVVVATGTGFRDALAAAGLAGLDGAPVILTDGKSLSSQASTELKRLAPSKVYVVGGDLAVSPGVFNKIKAVANPKVIKRLKGNNSASTSAMMALEGKGQWDGTAIIATNKTFKDALSAAPVSYAKHWPILLADDGVSISNDVKIALIECEITKVIIVGGTSAVTTKVEEQLNEIGIEDENIERWEGKTGTLTSAEIARKAIGLGMSPNNIGVATSQGFPDALAGAALCGKNNAVLILADDKDTANRTFPSAYQSAIKRMYVFGGRYAVGNTTWCWLICSAA